MSDSKPRRELTYATVCSGIECCSVSCIGLPMRPVFFSEIEPFPCAVLKAHYPDVPNLGDMSKIQVSQDGKEITNGTVRIILDRRIDILAGGTPCQDVSVAGKRAGMREGSGTRSSLAFDFVRLARELRPKYVVWENVGATISSKIAGDFLHFLANLGDCGYSLAWRVLDAQYVRVDGMERAVPQRRRRVWVVGCLGADESVPAQILFEPDCVAGHTPPRRRAGQGFAYSLAGRDRVDAGVVGNATERGDGGCLNPLDPQSMRLFTPDGAFHTVGARSNAGQHSDGVCIALDGDKLKPREDQRKGGNGFGINEEGVGYTLTGVDRHGVAYESQCYENHAQDSRVQGPIDTAPTQGSSNANSAGVSGNNPLVVHTGLDGYNKTLTGINPQGGGMNPFDHELGETQSVCHQGGIMQVQSHSINWNTGAIVSHPPTEEVSQTMRNAPHGEGGVIQTIGFKAGQSADGGLGDEREVSPILSHKPSALEPTLAQSQCDLSLMRYIVRRLTPTEAERLMGLPSGYTIPRGLRITDELVAEFQRIHDTFGAIMAEYEHKPAPRPKSANQVRAWLEKVTNPDTCPDSPRYHVCGNGWATNQPRWILARLLAIGEDIDPFTGEEL